MRHYNNLIDDDLENWFASLISDIYEFEDYYPRSGQIPLNQLDESQSVRVVSRLHISIKQSDANWTWCMQK